MNKTAILKVKGAYYYKVNELFHKGLLTSGMAVRLEHHPDNPYDKNAVAVISEGTGSMLGHISRKVSSKYAKIVNKNRIVAATLENISEKDGFIDISIRIVYKQYEEENSRNQNTLFWQTASKFPTTPGVYTIINLLTGRQYIGSSANIKNRIKSHVKDLSLGCHANHTLQTDFNSLGLDYFEAKVIEKNVPKAELSNLESNFISSLIQSGADLYNITTDGQKLGFKPDKSIQSKPITDVIKDNTAESQADMKRIKILKEFESDSTKLLPKFSFVIFVFIIFICVITINYATGKNGFEVSTLIISAIISLIITGAIQSSRKKKVLQGPEYSQLIKERDNKLDEIRRNHK